MIPVAETSPTRRRELSYVEESGEEPTPEGRT